MANENGKVKKYVLVDLDDTLTDPNPELDNPHLNAWIGRALPNALDNSNGMPRYQIYLAKIAQKILDHKRKKNQDTDPKPKDIRALGVIARGIKYKDLVVGIDEMPLNSKVVKYLLELEQEGYTIGVATMSVTPYTQNWLKDARILRENGNGFIDAKDVKGLELKFSDENLDGTNPQVLGLDRSDPYTKHASNLIGGNAQRAKSYFAAKLIDDGHEVAYSIGNSYTDLLSNESVVNALIKDFKWEKNRAIQYMESKPILNVHLPAGGDLAVYRNGDLDNPLEPSQYTPILAKAYAEI